MKTKTLLLALLAYLVPITASAHVKWFAEPVGSARPYQITDLPVIFGIIVLVVAVLIAAWLERKLSVPAKLLKYVEKFAPSALSIASIGFGLAFIIFSTQGFIFAPNLIAEGSIGTTLLIIQLIAGLMMLFGIFDRIAGLFVIFLFILGAAEFGAVEMLDTLEMLGFAVYMLIVGRPKWKMVESDILKSITHKFHAYGHPILRVGTGLNLIGLGLSEKIFAPSLTQNFLNNYNWNFMQTMGMSGVTDYWFAYAAGISEILFGVLLVLGLVTRTTTIALAGFLVTTLILLGPVELIGHLPHFSIAVVLLVLGSGSKLTISPLLKK